MMDPVFIYYNKVNFQNDYKVFKVDFSDGDNLQAVLFKKNRDYYITSMSCFITLEQDLKELTHYDDIKKISEISNKILKNGKWTFVRRESVGSDFGRCWTKIWISTRKK